MQDEEAFALKKAQEYTWKFFENKSSPEKQKNKSPAKEAFKGQEYRLEQERKAKQELMRARKARSPLKLDGCLGKVWFWALSINSFNGVF